MLVIGFIPTLPIVVCVLMLNAVCDDEELNRKLNSYSSKEEKKRERGARKCGEGRGKKE